MARIRLFHWRAEEAKPLLTVLEAAGHSVDYDARTGPARLSKPSGTRNSSAGSVVRASSFKEPVSSYREVRVSPPDAVVIDLSRLPSHGREVAVFLRGSKATRHIPIVFVGGDPEKVEHVRRVLPDAVYTPASRLRGALRSAIANPPSDPLKPAQMMQRWGARTTAQKLGIAANSRVFVIDPPAGYARAIGELPEGASFEEESADDCKVALWFVHGIAEFHAALPRMRRLAVRSRLWILWRKSRQARTGPARPSKLSGTPNRSAESGSVVRASSLKDGLNGNEIRAGAIDVGLVDYKICSIDETWSAMVFAVKKAR